MLKAKANRSHVFCALYVLPPFDTDRTIEKQMTGIAVRDEISKARITFDPTIGKFTNYFWLMRFDLQLKKGSLAVEALALDSPLNYDQIYYDAIFTMPNDPSEYILLEKNDEFEKMLGSEYFWVAYSPPIGRLRPPDASEDGEMFFGTANLIKLSAPLLLSKLVDNELRSLSDARTIDENS